MHLFLVMSALLVMPVGGVVAQEYSSRGNLSQEANWTSLKNLVDSVRGQAESAQILADALSLCNAKKMLYAPTDPAKDTNGCVDVIDPRELVMRTETFNLEQVCAGKRCAADATTVEHMCELEGFGYATGYSTNSYSSPGDNTITRWDGTKWVAFRASQDNRFLRTITCQMIDFK